MTFAHEPYVVMPGLVPGIHAFRALQDDKTWMAGTSPAMTDGENSAREIIQ